MRDRFGLPVVLVLAVVGAFGAGLTWMTHMHHRALRYVEPGQMAAFDAGYERLSDVTVIPVGIVGIGCSLALWWLRPRGVPRWMIGCVLALQISVFVLRVPFWGAWAEDVREAGSVWLADGNLHPSYLNYMDTNWIRILIVSGYAVLAAVMMLRAIRGAATTRLAAHPS